MKFMNEEFSDLGTIAKQNTSIYANAEPFPNISFNNFFNTEVLDAILQEFGDLSKQDVVKFDGALEKKLASNSNPTVGNLTQSFFDFLNSDEFLEFLQELTGIKEKLIADVSLHGGGLHQIKKGGFLKIHSDFNKHPDTGLDRRINLLIYLNKDWKEEYGGYFELWNRDMTECVKRVLPNYNTCAIFSTTDFSYHGHPDSLTCPETMSRKSLALYYYSDGRPAEEINSHIGEHNTLFKERVGNELDKQAFSSNKSVFSKIKKELNRVKRRFK